MDGFKKIIVFLFLVSIFAVSDPVQDFAASVPVQDGKQSSEGSKQILAFAADAPVVKEPLSFYEFRAYMCGQHMHGLYAYSHSNARYFANTFFVSDLESNQLFKAFRAALRSSDPQEVAEARKTYAFVLIGLNDCLMREVLFVQKNTPRYKRIDKILTVPEVLSIAFALTASSLNSFEGAFASLSVLGVCAFIRAFTKPFDDLPKKNLLILQERIEMWKRLLTDPDASLLLIWGKVLLENKNKNNS